MRTGRGVVAVAAGLLLLGITGQVARAQQPAPPAAAAEPQPDPVEDVQLTRAVIQAERQAIVTRAMDLTPEEMQRFWPVYREYRLEAVKLGDRAMSLIERYVDDYDALTDATANTLLTEFVKIEQARASLKAKFLPRFKKVLPAKKVVRFYQLENKLDITILAELAEAIPLAR